MPDIGQQIGFRHPVDAATGAFQVINALQDLPPADQVIALTAAFYLVTDALNVDRSQALHTLWRMDCDCAYADEDTFNVVRDYARGEIERKFL
ncbi:hypothetical protein [Dyella silvatica]|uniref:hypothetical protein n=1 Tax=Dyella silvatica TaxID=2992128 RepID=UPI002250B250|nr:hypothetical protein [Dyella silvatica]